VQSEVELLAPKHPAATKLAARQEAAAGVVEDRRERHVQELGDLADVEDVFTGEVRTGGLCALRKHDCKLILRQICKKDCV
jgi:hypothetical protein